jgi:hypothetical protein
MEIIIVLAAITVVALAWAVGKSKDKEPIDNWEPPKEMHLTDKPWPYGEKLSEGKIHVKTTDVAGSENRVEAPAPVVTNSNPADNVPVTTPTPAKKAPAKKTADKKPAAAKKTPAKKKSV